MVQRTLQAAIDEYLKNRNHKIFFIWGPRRSGKTTLLKKLSKALGVPCFNFDLFSDYEKFIPDKTALKKIISEHRIILIDEIQNCPESTLALKILFDEFDVKVIATGSSELRQKSKQFDSLAGRFTEHYCLPLSLEELHNYVSPKAYEKPGFFQNLQRSLQIFGAYPEVYTAIKDAEKIQILENIIDTYILKDIISLYNLQNVKLAKDILVKIALQIGSEVSVRELASSLGSTAATISSILEIFVKNYILIPLPSFKTNLRRAVSKHHKYYFADLGLRNALIKDFRALMFRPDHGQLFENFIVIEFYKALRNYRLPYSMYFYREYNGKEIDLVLEDYQKNYQCFEIKKTKEKIHNIFPLPHKMSIINAENYWEVIGRKKFTKAMKIN